MKKFWEQKQGSISVYFIIIFVPIFLFQALFVDLIRIRAASRESEQLLKSGLRSVMSQYSHELADYGLYGLPWDADKSQQVFLNTVKGGLEQNNTDAFRYIDTALKEGSSQLKPVYTLGNPTVLKRQMVQDMKIKAPVEFLTELLDKFKKNKAVDLFETSSNYFEQADKLEEIGKKREEALDRAKQHYQSMLMAANLGMSQADSSLSRLQELAGKIGLKTKNDIETALKDTEAAIQNLESTISSIQGAILNAHYAMAALSMAQGDVSAAIGALAQHVNSLQMSLSESSRQMSVLMTNKEQLQRVLGYMAEYALLYLSSQKLVSVAEQSVRESFDSLSKALDEAGQYQRDWEEELKRLSQSRTDDSSLPEGLYRFGSLYDYDYFVTYKTEAAKIPAGFSGLMMRWGTVQWWESVRWDDLLAEVQALKAQIHTFTTERSKLEQERSALNGDRKNRERDYRNKVESAIDSIVTAINPCAASPDSYKSVYARIEGDEGLMAKYKDYNKLSFGETAPAAVPGQAKKSIGSGLGLLKKIGTFLTDLRDELIVNEYVLDKFNYRTTGLGDNKPNQRTQPEGHPLERQEAEYVLYGFNSCLANQSAAYGELFLVLFAIRTIETMMEPHIQALNLGTPLLVLLAAAAEGATKAVIDTQNLANGGSVPLLKKLGGFQMTYKDFLRLFLLLHPNQSGVLTRVQVLVDLNTGVDLTQATTYVEGTETTSVKLWFMPGLAKLLNQTLGAGGTVEEGRSLITKSAVYAYD